MNLYHKKQRWKIALLGAAILLVVASIWFSYRIVNKVQQREVERIEQWAESVKRKSELVNLTNRAFEELTAALSEIQIRDFKTVEMWALAIEEANRPLDDYSFVVRILGEVSTAPMIVTDMNENVVSSYNVSALDTAISRFIRTTFPTANRAFRDSVFTVAKADSLESYLPVWRKNHQPIEMDLYRSEKQKVFYFDSVFFKNEKLAELRNSRDSLVDAFSNELVNNEFLVPVVFIHSDTRRIISTNMPEFDSLTGPVPDARLPQSDSIVVDLGGNSKGIIYFEHSPELIQMKYFPFVQFFMIGLFILIAYLVFSTFRKAEQDQVWVGMAKETAHQLGTPISSLMAWNELLAAQGVDKSITSEIEKDIDRLNTVTNRFSKIGSDAVLESIELAGIVGKACDYLRRRISSKIEFTFVSEADGLHAMVNPALLEWVIENIVKNAVDATEGAGKIQVRVHPFEDELWIDITDNGKGIPANKLKTVFQPGYTTKKRGWGLGLSLAKRIVDDFHKGKIAVIKSEPGIATTFRITLKQV
ncbi:MAG: HAMP domain-containing histidine kinase [Bacteroidetes bacterium]|nr:HAMP domain-containing histidine kinase [Bacteroidota bacterium]